MAIASAVRGTTRRTWPAAAAPASSISPELPAARSSARIAATSQIGWLCIGRL
jgi:hypothetical protein